MLSGICTRTKIPTARRTGRIGFERFGASCSSEKRALFGTGMYGNVVSAIPSWPPQWVQ